MRVLYVSQTGMTEPLGRSQVVPYLVGLARAGFAIDLFTFEPESATADAITRVRSELGDHGIGYQWLPRRRAHDLGTKARESTRALLRLVAHALQQRPRLIHARSTLAATVGYLAARVAPGARLLFDCRGLVADEYADFGHWQRGSLRYRLFKGAENQLFRRADALVVLTDRLRRFLRDQALVPERTPIEVIPCCVDLDRFRVDDQARAEQRQALEAGDRFVLVYAGNLGWGCVEPLAELFAAIRRRRPALFAVYSEEQAEELRAALARRGVAPADLRIAAAAPDEMPRRLAAGDAGVFFAQPRFSKIASSAVKVAEYLAVGLPVVVNRGIGDQDALIGAAPDLVFDAGHLGAREIDAAATRLLASPPEPARSRRAHALAADRYGLEAIGVARYRRLYERLAD